MTGMRYRPLGASGIMVSELCLGTMMFGGATPEAEARRIVDHALAHGVNFIDTANAYVEGRSEEVVGGTLAGRRDKVILATKVANPIGAGVNDKGLSRVHVIRELENSLRRLKTDYIDLYYVHKIDPLTPWGDVVETFGGLIRQGKIRAWGLSNVRAWHIAEIAHLCRRAGMPGPTALQPYYNLMNRQPETEVLPAARNYGLGVVPYSPIARGVLSGKYKPNATPPPESRAGRKDKRMLESEWRPESLLIAETLRQHAEARGTSLVAWATAWVLNNASVSAAIAGPRTFEQWTSYFPALDYAWSKEDEALANSLVPTGHPSTPGYNDPQYPIEGRFARVE
jgi:aryl-alcohol dehydrogenase (NADP+)